MESDLYHMNVGTPGWTLDTNYNTSVMVFHHGRRELPSINLNTYTLAINSGGLEFSTSLGGRI